MIVLKTLKKKIFPTYFLGI